MQTSEKPFVQVKDVVNELIAPPYSLRLARAITGPFNPNGSKYIGIHSGPNELDKFLLTSIVDETTPDISDSTGKLMIQGGTQYGCAFHCPFCVFSSLPLVKNLSQKEIIDLFSLSFYLHGRHTGSHRNDKRRLVLKFSDNGEPLENPDFEKIVYGLWWKFGMRKRKTLMIKVSTILADTPTSWESLRGLMRFQSDTLETSSVHLQISRAPYKKEVSCNGELTAEVVREWSKRNPRDKVCIAPGIASGWDREKFFSFCKALLPVKDKLFFRLTVIKPSQKTQEKIILPDQEYLSLYSDLLNMGFEVSPLDTSNEYKSELRGAGTLSHLPNGKFYDPRTYQISEYVPGIEMVETNSVCM